MAKKNMSIYGPKLVSETPKILLTKRKDTHHILAKITKDQNCPDFWKTGPFKNSECIVALSGLNHFMAYISIYIK